MAKRKRLWDESMPGEEEAKRMETKYASLKEDYVELQRYIRALRKRAGRSRNKKKRLQIEVRFLQHKKQLFTEKDHAKVLSVYRKPKGRTEVLAIEDKPARCELTGLQPLMSTDHHTSHEIPSPMSIMSAFPMPQSSFVRPVVEQANKKRSLENNGLVSAQKPSKVKNGRKKKIKADLYASPEYSAKSITIPKRPKEPTEALSLEDKSARHELTGMQTFPSTDDRAFPEMPLGMRPSFKVPHSSLVTPAVVDDRSEKIKADPLTSTEFRAKIISISKRPKEPTEGLDIADKPSRHELTQMQPLSSTDDCTAPEMTGQQPSAIRIIPGSKVLRSSLVTPTVEPDSKKRRLKNNGLTVTSAEKPSKVKDHRDRKIRADPLVSPEFVARNISISRKPKEPTEALAIEDKPARYELTRMHPLLSTDDCTLPERTRLQPSDPKIMTAFTEPHRSLATPIVEPANKKRRLKHNGLVSVEKPSNVKDGQNKKIKAAPLVSLEKPKEPTEALPFEYWPTRHESMGMQLFSSPDASTLAEISRLKRSAARMIPDTAKLQSSLVTCCQTSD